MKSLRLISAFFVLCAALALAGQIHLKVDPQEWKAQVPDTAGVELSEAVGFAIVDCERGKCLSIGPWRAGRYGARYEYETTLPVTNGRVSGWYITSGLLPRQASVTVQFYKGGNRLSLRSFPLAAAPRWSRFEAPVFRAPTGAESVRIACGLSEHTEGRVLFSDVLLTTGPFKRNFPAGLPNITRPKPPAAFKPSKYFRIERSNGVWWLVSPEGKPTFSIGTDPGPFRPAKAEDPEQVVPLMRGMGFNSLAGWHNQERWAAQNDRLVAEGRPALIQFRSLQTRTVDPPYEIVRNAQGLNPGEQSAQAVKRGGFNHGFPDPWDPRWEKDLRARVRKIAALVRDKPYFAGWFADNEREHRELHRYVYSTYSAAELRKFLQRRYGAIAALNRAWGGNYESFDDLVRQKPDPVARSGAMYGDFHAFRRELLRKFNHTVLSVIREEDPGRLVFTNRFMIGEGRDLIENLDLYADYDAVCINIYPANIEAGLSLVERQTLEVVHQRTGKPLLIGEWSVPALDSGLYNKPDKLDWSYPNTVDTQQERARQAARVAVQFYNMPFLIGAHWFIWTDFDSEVRQANRGLFKVNGEPWTELQQALTQANRAIEAHMSR